MANVTKSGVGRMRHRLARTVLQLSPAEAGKGVLVRRAQQGDTSAYEELVRGFHQRRILGVIGGILHGSEDVEDVAQQALAKAYFSIQGFDLRSAFGTWLYKIAVNECWDYLRKKKVRRLVYEANLSEEQVRKLDAVPEHGFGDRHLREDTGKRRVEQRQLIERLLGRTRGKRSADASHESEVEGFFSRRNRSAVLGLNVNTVKVRLFRARGRLVEIYRKRLNERSRFDHRGGMK